jgi:hypothetical protein
MSLPTLKPLNGEKTHPLTAHAINTLTDLNRDPWPRQALNPGVVDRLLREALVVSVDLISPYKSHRGKRIEHLRITDAGIAALKAAKGGQS